MGFSTFVVAAKNSPAGTGFGCALLKMRPTAPARLKFYLRPAVAEELGWADGDRLMVQLGHDEDHGLIRLRKGELGTAAVSRRPARAGTHFFEIALGVVPGFVDRSEGKKWCQFEVVEEGWVEVVLPSWADETGPARQRLVPARPLAIAPPPRRPADRLPGDPPPGRSALEQRPPTRGEARRQAYAVEEEATRAAEVDERSRDEADLERLAGLQRVFGLSPREAAYVHVLMDGRPKTRERLLMDGGTDETEDVDIKTVDVFISKIRKKLATRFIVVETIRGHGYQMLPDQVGRVMVLLDEAA